jgi:hypothetical protein
VSRCAKYVGRFFNRDIVAVQDFRNIIWNSYANRNERPDYLRHRRRRQNERQNGEPEDGDGAVNDGAGMSDGEDGGAGAVHHRRQSIQYLKNDSLWIKRQREQRRRIPYERLRRRERRQFGVRCWFEYQGGSCDGVRVSDCCISFQNGLLL